MIIGINCGHTVSGQPGCGAVGYIDESVETRAVGNRLMSLLERAGHTVINCTNDRAVSTSENLSAIVSMANAQKLDLFISIHFNSGGGHGTEIFTYKGEVFDEAAKVLNAICGLGFTNRGIKDGSNLAVVRRTNAKAMLVEVCFVDSASDAGHYRELGSDAVAQAICSALTGYTPAEIREEIKMEEKTKMIYDYVDENMPAWYRDDVQWMRDRKLLVGDEEGRLGLTDEDLKTISLIVRTAKYLGNLMNMKL